MEYGFFDHSLRKSFAETVNTTILTISNLTECSVPIWNWVFKLAGTYKELDTAKVLRKLALQGCFYITRQSLGFLLAVKPWRLTALRESKENAVMTIPDTSSDHYQQKRLKIPKVRDLLEKLTRDKKMAQSIHSLSYGCNIVKFDKLYSILKRLKNIKELDVNILEYGKQATHFRQAMHRLERLRSLELFGEDEDPCWTSAPAMLLNKLRVGRVIMKMANAERLSTSTTEFAYRGLTIKAGSAAHAEKLIEFVQRCPHLNRLSVVTHGEMQLDQLKAPNLLIFEVYCQQNVDIFQLLMPLPKFPPSLPQNRLKLLIVTRTELDWPSMSGQCPNIRNLYMTTVIIKGRVTGLPLTILSLKSPVTRTNDTLPRLMCAGTLSHFGYDSSIIIYNMRNFKDWISHPQFLAGALIVLGTQERRLSRKRLILYLKEKVGKLWLRKK